MDQELTTYLDGRFSSLAKLVEEHSDSLQREMAGGFDRVEAATARNTKLLAGGSKAVAALTEWAQKLEPQPKRRAS